MEKWCDENNYINFVTVGSLLLKGTDDAQTRK
jgi:hypothetical protein